MEEKRNENEHDRIVKKIKRGPIIGFNGPGYGESKCTNTMAGNGDRLFKHGDNKGCGATSRIWIHNKDKERD